MQFKHKTLDNGLNIIGEVNPAAQSAAVGFFAKTGARDENDAINGVSHFLEHMMFKGTDKLTALEVNEAFDRTGAQFNAFTSEENTVYYAAVLPEYLEEVADLWTQLMRPSLRDDDFNMEKNVILEEIAMYQDLPHFDVMDRARSLHFNNHPCGYSVLGTDESIKNLTSSQMREYFSRRYASDNLTLVCCGNFDWDALCKLAETNCGGWKASGAKRQTPAYQGNAKTDTVQKQGLIREHICIVSPSVSAQHELKYAAMLTGVILGDDTGSRLFWSLVDTAKAEIASSQYDPMDGTGAIYSYLRCGTENSAEVLEITKAELEKLHKDGVTEDELNKARNKVLSTITLKNELPMGRLIEVGINWTYLEEYRTIDNEVANVKAVTAEQINQMLREYNPAECTTVIMRPKG
ncbi:Protease 3 precursor [Limihaloglobus sulfuriphilus]|uniref:Protease 3 n=1 Tax=Limihaloglobus sulfuriphilus TaxID=1851148 RepID=A0A1Q2MJC7_9BACT|nr:pitrilysin family protein [Limihaloglobus sulfuriphilus]AQQ72512.1 Protease 3 precursor [Limihaloglobus sulfuriphilus]